MKVEFQRGTNEITLKIVGRIDTITAPDLEEIINDDIKGSENLILDIEEVEYISSAGLRVLLAAQKKLNMFGTLKVRNVRAEVMEVFELTGFTDILEIE